MIKDTMLTRIGNDCDEKSTKFIGTLFDENLTWRDHVSHVNKKISRALFSIKQVRNTLPVECLRTLLFTCIFPFDIWVDSMGECNSICTASNPNATEKGYSSSKECQVQ